ncbi:UDP-N-acetylmuramate dehydrogenase [Petrotoga sp. 9PWA.NaAc.5.4]|uniref:UDP-N-acetylmuramate dehydrogenase n=1 Tax=Petrotoga sp. 9PWA.NaAc.5.4 TaxID=1434328 RepID=UPI000CBD4931|nr:UDP-N-acetylmuramate dehydrogenase [Petrotoga sp. 9PWA.NaAc.5.4]PNR96311.1 UDP-N-acetylenolpyruvoylglucosamine reductase [Petrotoga sp. 9PWA.NaAc.5.4]
MNLEKLMLNLYINGCEIKSNELMKYYTNMRVGGKISYIIFPKTKKAFLNAAKELVLNQIPFKILGFGTNLIVADNNLNFLVLSTKYLTNLHFMNSSSNEFLFVEGECGVSLASISLLTSQMGYSGLEFACGIPGSLGGAVYMNAGAYESEIKEVFMQAEVLDLNDLSIKIFEKEDMNFNYRKSILQSKDYILLSAKLVLKKDNKENIDKRIKDFSIKRWVKQPLDIPSAGSIFKRPSPNFYVGSTIEKLGLKGYSIGDAQISTKHAGFIVNTGKATYKEVIALIDFIKNTIKEKYDVELEVEPEIWE